MYDYPRRRWSCSTRPPRTSASGSYPNLRLHNGTDGLEALVRGIRNRGDRRVATTSSNRRTTTGRNDLAENVDFGTVENGIRLAEATRRLGLVGSRGGPRQLSCAV